DFSTGGSRGIRDSHQYVREGGAAARIMLIQAAANAWSVPVSECSAANSVITHKPSGRTVTYGKVAEAAAKLTPPEKPALKDPKEWKLIGKSVKRLDTMDKLNGAYVYGADLKLPGMLNAATKDCHVFGCKVNRYEADKVASMPGVKQVVQVATPRWLSSQRRGGRRRRRSTSCRSCGTRGRTRRSRATRSPRCSGKASMPTRRSSATATATSRPPSP